MRVKIKFCGITRAEDAATALDLGVDALGFVFHPPSPRWVKPAAAAAIIRTLPPFVSRVGLFVNAAPAWLAAVVDEAGLDVVQFHGDERPGDCAAAPRPWIKAIRVRPGLDLAALAASYTGAGALLFDSYDPRLYGGTGEVFDWTLLAQAGSAPRILAGGLDAGNVGAAIRAVRPYAVDVSGGIEAAKGIKDRAKMRAFVDEVRRVEREA